MLDNRYFFLKKSFSAFQVQCLVQLSTLPVAVCYGTGQDAKFAHNDAARNALNYLKMMTKRSAGSGGKK